jgi:hypothetical protein
MLHKIRIALAAIVWPWQRYRLSIARRPIRSIMASRSQLRHRLSTATLMSALNSTDPLILRTALTNLIPVARAKLAIDK